MEEIKSEILKALEEPNSFLAMNFELPKNLIAKYSLDLFFEVIERLEEENIIYWERINSYTIVIKKRSGDII